VCMSVTVRNHYCYMYEYMHSRGAMRKGTHNGLQWHQARG
jgi:hypothetical protein